MRNIMGQTKSGFSMRDIMDNKKILLVNLSKGKMGELNSKLIGMIFVMKFQAAAMGRADMAEEEREDFCLYVDEFQNFATESFESILSEARKYRLNLVLANQFMTQLTDKIREAIIGNVGTVISGRIGVTDAELMVKKFQPTFDTEDLIKLPNREWITSVMINNMPSAPFSMSSPGMMCQPNLQLAGAMMKLSATKYGFSRAVVEKEIFSRLEPPKPPAPRSVGSGIPPGQGVRPQVAPSPGGGSSFLDEWLSKRQNLKTSGAVSRPVAPPPSPSAVLSPARAIQAPAPSQQVNQQQSPSTPVQTLPAAPQAPVVPTGPTTPISTSIASTEAPRQSQQQPIAAAQQPVMTTNQSSSQQQPDPGEVSVRLR